MNIRVNTVHCIVYSILYTIQCTVCCQYTAYKYAYKYTLYCILTVLYAVHRTLKSRQTTEGCHKTDDNYIFSPSLPIAYQNVNWRGHCNATYAWEWLGPGWTTLTASQCYHQRVTLHQQGRQRVVG